MSQNEGKKERKKIKISLGTVICIFIIIILLAALTVTILYYNKIQEKNNIAEENEITLEEIGKKVEEKYYTGSYFGIFPEFQDINEADEEWLWFMLRAYANEKYRDDENKLLTYSEVENLSKEFFGNKIAKNFPESGAYGFNNVNGNYDFRGYVECPEGDYYRLVVKDVIKNNDNYEVAILEYDLVYADILKFDEVGEGKVEIYNIDGEKINEYDYKLKTSNGITKPIIYDGDKEINEDYIDRYIVENAERLIEKKLVIEYNPENEDCYIQSCKIMKEVDVKENHDEDLEEIAKSLCERAEREIVKLHASDLLHSGEYDIKYPIVEKEINGEIYVETTEKYEVLVNKYKEIFTGKALENILKTWRYVNVDGVLYVSRAGGASGWETIITHMEKMNTNNEEIMYIAHGITRENEYLEEGEIYFKIKKVNGEYRISDIDLLGMEVDKKVQNNNDDNNKYIEDIYVYGNNDEYTEYETQFQKIKFLSNGMFYIDTKDCWAIAGGKYEMTNEYIKCYLQYYQTEGDAISIYDNKWEINFKIIDDNKLKVVSNNIEGESEIAISIRQEFAIDNEFNLYDIKDFIGKWKTDYAYIYDEEINNWVKEESMTMIFGTSYLGVGSNITLEENGTFLDYIFPMTENEIHRNGNYSFEENKIILNYLEGDLTQYIYIINNNKLAYHNGWVILILEKNK